MIDIEKIINDLKKEILCIPNDEISKFIFIGGYPGSGKSLLIEKAKKDFQNSNFVVIEPDLYRDYFCNDFHNVEDTVAYSNKIEIELLKFSINNKKNIISISTFRSYEFIDKLINDTLTNKEYQIYFYVMATDIVTSSLSTYERYICDKASHKPFPRLNRHSYLDIATKGFNEGIDFFSNKNYFKNAKFYLRGKDFTLPVEIEIKKIEDVFSSQICNIDLPNLSQRIKLVLSQLNSEYEIKEFSCVINNIILKNILKYTDKNIDNIKIR